MKQWEIRRNPKDQHTLALDVVYFDESMSKDEVRQALIDHDGYPVDITVHDMD